MNSVADVWQVVLERLRAGGLAETAISTWFDEVEAVAIRDMTFYLCCPNDFKRGTIESLFLPNLKAALKEIFSADFDVKLLSAAERDAFAAIYSHRQESNAPASSPTPRPARSRTRRRSTTIHFSSTVTPASARRT